MEHGCILSDVFELFLFAPYMTLHKITQHGSTFDQHLFELVFLHLA
jgi:hypothetical protein